MASHYVSTPVRNNGRNWLAQERQSGPVSPSRVRQCAWQARGRRFESAMLHRKIEFRISTAVLFGTAFSLPTGQWTTIRTGRDGCLGARSDVVRPADPRRERGGA
jgi:hypothetical protein